MFIRSFSIWLGLFLLVSTQTSVASPKIEHWQTANGVRVLFVEAPEIPMLDVRIVFDAGSARDSDRPGLGKLTNSLLAQGAGELNADQIAEQLENLGAELSASARRDMAWLSLRTLTQADVLEPALAIFQTILSQPCFATQDLERQRQAMLVGLRQGEQSPGTIANKAFYHQLYEEHPYAIHSGGTEASLTAITQAEIKQHYQQYYVAQNAVLAIVGAVDRARAEQIAQQLTAGLKEGKPAPALPEVAPLAQAEQHQIAFPSSQSHLYLGQPGMQRKDPDYFALYVGNHILGGSGLVSLLVDEVREKRGLSYSVYSYFIPMHQQGPFLMVAQTKGSQTEQALQVMHETLAQFREQGPTEEQLLAAKQNITGSFPLRIASNSSIVEYLAMIGFYRLPLDYLATFNQKVEQITVEQIHDAFQRRVQPDRLVTVIVGQAAS